MELFLFMIIVISIVSTFIAYSYFIIIKKIKKEQQRYDELIQEIGNLEETKRKVEEAYDYKTRNMENLLLAKEEECQRQFLRVEEDIKKKEKVLKDKYDNAEATYKNHFLELMEESSTDFFFKMKEYKDSVTDLEDELKELQVAYNSRIEVAKHEQEEANKRDYYRWQLSDAAIEDIKRMEQIKPSLTSPVVLDKVLWKTYYEKATNDLINRVIGNSNPCGIYKITNLLNEKVYIGQSNACKDRLKQHVKSGVGAVAATNNKLYTSMKQDGLWNFTWEVIEECPREKLNEREAFWIDFYDAAGYGLNGQRGNGS